MESATAAAVPHPQFTPPYSMLLIGPSNSGKSSWLLKLLANLDAMHTRRIDHVLLCYDHYQPVYDQMRAMCPRPIQFTQGFPYSLLSELNNQRSPADVDANPPQTLLIMDDLMLSAKMNDLAALFTFGRHQGINPILVLHNLTHKGRGGDAGGLLTINRNCSYRVLFSIPSDVQNVRTIQTQMFPHLPRFLMDVYQDACCSRPYGYLVLDSRPTSDNDARAYSNIWPGEQASFYIAPNCRRHELTIPGDQQVPIDYFAS